MAGENIRLTKPHVMFKDGYFYMFDDDTGMLVQKTDDGLTAFSYPFDELLDKPIVSAEYDGVNFWSMEEGSAANTLVIKRWRIQNYTCKLQEALTLASPSHVFSSNAFTVEHYHCTISGSYSSGDTIITAYDTTNSPGALPGELTPGMTVTIGPNILGQFETRDVQYVHGTEITLADPLEHSYSDKAILLFYNNFWLFNNANGTDTANAALYKISAYSGSVLSKYPSGIYSDIKAATFSEISHFDGIGTVNALLYVKASNLLFVNINSTNLDYYGSMTMDNLTKDQTEIYDVFDLFVRGNDVFRLQHKATYFGQDVTFDGYHYQPATFNTMVASIGLTASPNVLAANNISASSITARVKDQFGQPVQGRLVYFATDSDGSIVSGQEIVNTDHNGEAVSTFRSGSVAELAYIFARVDQV